MARSSGGATLDSIIYTAAAIDADASVAVSEAMARAVRAAEHAHPEGFTIISVSHDSQLVETTRRVEPTFFAAATGAGTAVTVQDQMLLVTAAVVVQAGALR
jgi:hypothetical protein